MSSKKTTQFPAASTLTGTEVIGVVQGGNNVQTTSQGLVNIQPTADPVVIGKTATGNNSTKSVVIGYGATVTYAVGGSQDNVSIGHSSQVHLGSRCVAIGTSAYANNGNSIAIGPHSSANNGGAIAIGAYATGNQVNSVAIGNGTQAQGYGVAIGSGTYGGTSSIAMGYNSATGYESVSIGYNTASSAKTINKFIVIGSTAFPTGTGGVAVGFAASAGQYSTAVGNSASASSNDCVAIGHGTSATANYSIAIGNAASSAGNYGIAIGPNATAQYKNSIVLGEQSKDYTLGSFVVGGLDRPAERYVKLLGFGTVALTADRQAAGTNNILALPPNSFGTITGRISAYTATDGSGDYAVWVLNPVIVGCSSGGSHTLVTTPTFTKENSTAPAASWTAPTLTVSSGKLVVTATEAGVNNIAHLLIQCSA